MAISKFRMSDTELLDYMDAATDPDKALDNLAVKNRTSRQIMRAYLGELGVVVDETEKSKPPEKSKYAPKNRRGGWYQSLIDDAKAMELYCQGKNDREIAEVFGVTNVSVKKWRDKQKLPSNYKPGGGKTKGDMQTVKDKRPVEDTVIEETEQRERAFEEILESVDAGKRTPEPCEPCAPTQPERGSCEFAEDTNVPNKDVGNMPEGMLSGYVVPQPVRAAEREALTVGEFLEAFGKYLTETVAAAPLRINGVAIFRDLEFSIRVQNEQVFVDLRTQEAG